MTSSIANETVDHSKNREPFSFYKFITNSNSRCNVNGVEPPDRASVKTPRRDTASAQRAASNPAAHDATPSASARTYVSR